MKGSSVRGLSWGAGPNVYLVHGWGGWGLQLSGFVRPLLNAGYRVVAFDMPSHGASDPGRFGPRASELPEFADALQAVVSSQGPAYALIAHSMGSTAAALALRDGLAVQRLVFISPMADPAHYLLGFAQLLGFGNRTRTRLQRRIEHRVGLPMAYFNVPRMARDMRSPPLLVIHDREDRETAWSDGASIAAAWPQARLMSTRGLGHRRIVADANVIASALDFVSGQVVERTAARRDARPTQPAPQPTRAPAYATLLAAVIAASLVGMSNARAQPPDESPTAGAPQQEEATPPAVGPTEDTPEEAEIDARLQAAERQEMKSRLRGLAVFNVTPAGL
jgi:pimeloyl-ACP methyl ester carboxylesterase